MLVLGISESHYRNAQKSYTINATVTCKKAITTYIKINVTVTCKKIQLQHVLI